MNQETPSSKLNGCTSYKIRQLARAVGQDYDDELSGTGLKITQYALLGHVMSLEPVRSVDLAAEMKMDSSTLSRNLKPLIQHGWLHVDPGSDGRSHLITLTKTGRLKRQEAKPHWHAAQLRLQKNSDRTKSGHYMR